MNKFLYPLVFALFLASGGCASVNPISFQATVIDHPPVGSVQTREIGDTLLEYYVASTAPSIRIPQQFLILGNPFEPQILRPVGVGEEVSVYKVEGPVGWVTMCFDPSESVLWPANPYGLCDFSLKPFLKTQPVKTEPATFVDIQRTNFRQEIIYNGKVGGSVKFLYREFRGDFIRAPFSQEVQYDLADSLVVGFKGARIEILSSTNSSIQYKVIKNFDR